VNSTLLKTDLKFTMKETETVRDLIFKVGQKVGENFMNEKMYVVLPVFKKINEHANKMQFLPNIADYGGVTSEKEEKRFNSA